MFYKVLVQFWSILVQGPYNCPAQGHFGPTNFNSTLIDPYLYPLQSLALFFLHTHRFQDWQNCSRTTHKKNPNSQIMIDFSKKE